MNVATFSSALLVKEARETYFAQNGFTEAGYTAPTFEFDVFGLRIRIPNFKANQEALPLHDLHHTLTGYGTDLTGEAEVAAWELAAGCSNLFLYAVNSAAALFGLGLSPIRVIKAFLKGLGHQSLYLSSLSYEEMLSLTLGELRQKLNIPEDGVAEYPGRLHRYAPRPT